MDPEHIAALQAFNSGVGGQTTQGNPGQGNTTAQQPMMNPFQQPAINPFEQPNHGPNTSNILDGATPINRPEGWNRPAHNVPCSYCDRMFTCNHNVQQHIREKHTFERPHACSVCAKRGVDKRFARPYTLYRHVRDMHHIEPVVENRRPRGRRVRADPGPRNAVPQRRSRRGTRPTTRAGEQPQQPHQPRQPQQPQPVHTAQEMPMNMLPQPAPQGPQYCPHCGSQLEGNEHAAMHLHVQHGVPTSPFCGCGICQSQIMHQAPQQQLGDFGFQQPFAPQPPAPQPPATFAPPIQQPQPRRPLSPNQLNQRLLILQQAQPDRVPEPEQMADYPPPIDPPMTPGPDGSEQQAPAPDPSQESFPFSSYSQFEDGFAADDGGGVGFPQLPDDILNELFLDQGNSANQGNGFDSDL